jgi:hypothetical protein
VTLVVLCVVVVFYVFWRVVEFILIFCYVDVCLILIMCYCCY